MTQASLTLPPQLRKITPGGLGLHVFQPTRGSVRVKPWCYEAMLLAHSLEETAMFRILEAWEWQSKPTAAPRHHKRSLFLKSTPWNHSNPEACRRNPGRIT